MATTGAFTDYTENKVLDHLIGPTAFTKPTLFLALYTAAPTDAAGGTEVSTTNWTNYTRKSVAFAAASSGSCSNSAVVDFGTVAGAGATITHWAIFDAATAGNMLVRGDFGTSHTASTGNQVTVPAGAITVSLD